jgi:hypothetical protein
VTGEEGEDGEGVEDVPRRLLAGEVLGTSSRQYLVEGESACDSRGDERKTRVPP